MKWLDSNTDSKDSTWENSGREWKTEEPGMPQSTRSQWVGHDLVAEQQQKWPNKKLQLCLFYV